MDPKTEPVEQVAARLAEAEQYVTQLESDVAAGFKEATGRDPSRSELEMESFKRAQSEGVDYYGRKRLVAAKPGPIRKAWGSATDAIGSVVSPVMQGAASALADRTQSLRAADSSLPHMTLDIPYDASAGAAGGDNYIPAVKSMTFGAEDVADAIEVGVPAAAELGAMATKRLGSVGKATSIVLGNVGAELSAEFLRAADRRASGLPNSAVNLSDPTDAALHFAKVASGGMILGGADILLNAGELRAQRKAYSTLLGLGSAESNEAIRKMGRLGQEASLSQAMTTPLKLIGTSLSIYPVTGHKAVKRARAIKEAITSTVSDSIGRLGDHLLSGAHLSGVSSNWAQKNDEYLQWARKKASASFDQAESSLLRAEQQFGTEQFHVPYAEVREDIRKSVIGESRGLPPDIKSSLEKNPDYQKLIYLIEEAPDRMLPSEALAMRNQMENAAVKAKGEHDRTGRIFAAAASGLRKATDNMVAPPGVLAEYRAAVREWSDYNALTRAPAWRAFKMADSRFGEANKFDAEHGISAQAVLQNAMADADITPDIVDTWWRAAREGEAVGAFRNSVSKHLKMGFDKSTVVPEKGPLEGIETINIDRFLKYLGADQPDSNKWAAHRSLIEKSGGNPDELVAFLEDMKGLFPDGIPNPSQTAARRTALSGVGSAVRMVTGGSALTSGMAGAAAAGPLGAVGGSIGSAVVSTLALLGVGQLMFNPAVLRKMRRVMDGSIDEQGRWRTLWGVASSMGITRALQNSLQEQGIDPLVTPTKAEQQERLQRAQTYNNPLPQQPRVWGAKPTVGPRP